MKPRIKTLLGETVTRASNVIMVAIYALLGVAGLSVALDASPGAMRAAMGPFEVLWAGLFLLSSVLGVSGIAAGWWGVERAAILSGVTASLMYAAALLTSTELTGNQIAPAVLGAIVGLFLGKRYLRIRYAALDPRR